VMFVESVAGPRGPALRPYGYGTYRWCGDLRMSQSPAAGPAQWKGPAVKD